MKKFSLIFFITIQSFAGNFFPVGKDSANTTYGKKSECEKKENHECYEMAGRKKDYVKVVVKENKIYDMTKPIYGLNKKTKFCEDSNACKLLLTKYIEDKECKDLVEDVHYFPFYNKEAGKIVCATIKSHEYEVKETRVLEIDEAKKLEYETKKLEEKAQSDAVAKEIQNQAFGQEMYALVKVVQKKKGLNKVQRKQLRSSFKEVKTMLMDGDLDLALDELKNITPDGTLISDEELQSLIQRIETHLGV